MHPWVPKGFWTWYLTIIQGKIRLNAFMSNQLHFIPYLFSKKVGSFSISHQNLSNKIFPRFRCWQVFRNCKSPFLWKSFFLFRSKTQNWNGYLFLRSNQALFYSLNFFSTFSLLIHLVSNLGTLWSRPSQKLYGRTRYHENWPKTKELFELWLFFFICLISSLKDNLSFKNYFHPGIESRSFGTTVKHSVNWARATFECNSWKAI